MSEILNDKGKEWVYFKFNITENKPMNVIVDLYDTRMYKEGCLTSQSKYWSYTFTYIRVIDPKM